MVPSEKEKYWTQADGIVGRFFEIAPPDLPMALVVGGMETAGGAMYRFRPGFVTVEVSKHEEQVICDYDELDLYGEEATFSDAWHGLGEHFDMLYREFVETDEPLHSSGKELAETLSGMVEAKRG